MVPKIYRDLYALGIQLSSAVTNLDMIEKIEEADINYETIRNIVFIPGKAEITTLSPSNDHLRAVAT